MTAVLASGVALIDPLVAAAVGDVSVTHYLVVGAILFAAGIVCMAVKRNALGVLMGIELVLNGANVNFVAFASPYLQGEGARGLGLDGQVIAVASGAIEVSLGSDDGLQVEHVLEVYRGGEYVGRAVVTSVSSDRAVARLVKSYARGVVQRGDRVTTRLKA